MSGHVAGDVDVSGAELEIAPSAQIDGRVIFRGPEPASVAPGALVRGEVVHVQSGMSASPWRRFFEATLLVTLAALGMAALGTVIRALAPGFTSSALSTIESRSGTALLAGLALALGAPIAVSLLSLSLVGIPLALLVACACLMSFPVGYALAAASIAERLHRRVQPGRGTGTLGRMLVLFATLLALGLLALLPVIGPAAIVSLTLIGTGALLLEAMRAIRQHGRAEGSAGDKSHRPARPGGSPDAAIPL